MSSKSTSRRGAVVVATVGLTAALVGSGYVFMKNGSVDAREATSSFYYSLAWDCVPKTGNYECSAWKNDVVGDVECDRIAVTQATSTQYSSNSCHNFCEDTVLAAENRDDYWFNYEGEEWFYTYGASYSPSNRNCQCDGYYCQYPRLPTPAPTRRPTPEPTTPSPTPEPTRRPTQRPTPRPTVTADFVMAGPAKPSFENTLSTTFAINGRKAFEIDFYLTVHAAASSNNWANIVHVGTQWWERLPLISLNPGTTKLHFTITQDWQTADNLPWNPSCDDAPALALNTETHVRMRLEHSFVDQYYLSVYINGVKQCDTTVVPRTLSGSHTIWFGDDSEVADVTVRDLKYYFL